MHRSLLKISIISFLSINSLSLAMETTKTFEIQKFSEDICRHIFVVAHPSIQNSLKRCSRSWHAIGAKKAPNMYKLVNDVSFNPHQDDWQYIMMHAALDKNVDVMSKVLDRTDRRNFDYDFGTDYLGDHFNKKQSFRLCEVYSFDTQHDEQFKGLDLASNSDKCKINFKDPLFRSCFAGDIATCKSCIFWYCNACAIDTVDKELSKFRTEWRSWWYNCIIIAIYNDNPYCIEILSPRIKHMVYDHIHLDLLRLAMCNNKKRAFRALVENNVYTHLNDPLCMHMGYNTTILDELNEQKDIPNLDDYITLYKELGGKSWQEVEEEDEEKENSLFSFCVFAGTFCSVQ